MMRANVITLALILGAVVWLLMHAYLVEWNAVKVAGAVVAGVSLVLLVVARLQLGAAFSVKAKAKTLVTTGLYSRIRNPIYVFGALMLVGMSVVLGNWVLLFLVALLTPVQMMRARKEEAVLAEAFGEKYARYKAGTWF
jgi:protein-S-isoprenylcysteine O-methyltransferase Ste14